MLGKDILSLSEAELLSEATPSTSIIALLSCSYDGTHNLASSLNLMDWIMTPIDANETKRTSVYRAHIDGAWNVFTQRRKNGAQLLQRSQKTCQL